MIDECNPQYGGARRFVASLDTGIPITGGEVEGVLEHLNPGDMAKLSDLSRDESVGNYFEGEFLNWVRQAHGYEVVVACFLTYEGKKEPPLEVVSKALDHRYGKDLEEAAEAAAMRLDDRE